MINFLKAAKCDIVQGYYYTKPLARDDFLKLIKAKASNS